jgi:hypothetical protein
LLSVMAAVDEPVAEVAVEARYRSAVGLRQWSCPCLTGQSAIELGLG